MIITHPNYKHGQKQVVTIFLATKPYQVASAATFRALVGLYMGKCYRNHLFGVYLKKDPK